MRRIEERSSAPWPRPAPCWHRPAPHAAIRLALDLAQIKKETDIACLYHCDFGDPQRFSQMLQNMLNHYSAYEFDTFRLKLVVVAHAAGIKFFLEDRTGTPWEKDDHRSGDLSALRRPDQVRGRGLLVSDHLQAPEDRSGQDAQGRVSQVRAVGSRNRGRVAGQGIRLSQGRLTGGPLTARTRHCSL